MDSSNRILWIAILVVSLGVGLLLLQPRIEQRLLPEPVGARVAVEVAGSGVARTGTLDLDVGTPFRLHAVLEARDGDGGSVWYTEAPRLVVDGVEIAEEAVEPWRRRPEEKVRWFTVEGLQPYLEVDPEGDLSRFEVRPFLRSTWPLGWVVPGEIDAANDDALERVTAVSEQRFGIQRYLVQIELYELQDEMLPSRRIRSPGPEMLADRPEQVTAVRMRLPGPLGPASEVFGSTQIEIEGTEPSDALQQAIDDLARRDLAFSRFTVIRDQIRGAGRRAADLRWAPAEPGTDVRWGADLVAGDLLRAGDRVVVVFEDRGTAGILDDDDLCFDYVQGAAVRRLGDVFTGEGQLELARLASENPTIQERIDP